MDEILSFWLTEVGPKGWFVARKSVDDTIRDRYLPLWESLSAGGLTDWCETARGALAYLIIADQFPRNMFRGDGRSFATDALARAAARRAICLNQDLEWDQPARVFFYMPFEHAESLSDQDWSVTLTATRLTDDDEYGLHAEAHREIIRRFGRFPFRNKALGRADTTDEQAFMDQGAYGAVVNALRESAMHDPHGGPG